MASDIAFVTKQVGIHLPKSARMAELSGNRSPINCLQPMSRTVLKARSAITGHFIPMSEAIKHPSTNVVEKVKVGPIKHREK